MVQCMFIRLSMRFGRAWIGVTATLSVATVGGRANSTVPPGTYTVQSALHPTITLRHCSFQLFGTNLEGPSADHIFQVVPGLDKAAGSVSLQSSNYPTKYIAETGDPEPGRLGVEVPSGPLEAFSFVLSPGPATPGAYTLQSKISGGFVTLSQDLTGQCAPHYNRSASEGDAVVAATATAASEWVFHAGSTPPEPPLPPETVSVFLDEVTHEVPTLVLGCHSDTGYAHQARGFYSQMVVGDSFLATNYSEAVWNLEEAGGATTTAALDPTDTLYGTPSTVITLSSSTAHHTDGVEGFRGGGGCRGGLNNRGLGNAGMVFASGKEYEGVLIARATGAAPITVTVSLVAYETAAVLAEQVLIVPAQGSLPHGYSQLNFSLTPNGSTSCHDIDPSTNPEIQCGVPISSVGHTCVACGGQLSVTLSSPGSVVVNYVLLQPGEWGRVGDLSVLASAATTLQAMGVTAIRQGGSFASDAPDAAAYYNWQNWTGPAWTRESRTHGTWRACLLAGWGPFEMIDMCNALGIEPIITTSEADTPEGFADLVEYAWGGPTTAMGRKRAADGHPEPYRVKYIELGNEQYNPNYVEQAAAMEAKATELGMPDTLYYIFPQNGFLNPADIAKANSLGLPAPHLLADIHIGPGGAVEEARDLFAKNAPYRHGAVNAETNARIHTMERALTEAGDLNDWFSAADVVGRLHFRTASFCMGDATDFDAWDQGISFFLPNMTWLQPPGYVHQMVNRTFQPRGLNVSSPSGPQAFSAQLSTNNRTVVLRYVNTNSASRNVTFELAASRGAPPAASVEVWTLTSADLDDANSPGNPSLVSPNQRTIENFGSGSVLEVSGYSYTVVVMPLEAGWLSY